LFAFNIKLSFNAIITILAIVTSSLVIFPTSAAAEVTKILVHESDSSLEPKQIIVQIYVVNNAIDPVIFTPDQKIKGVLRNKGTAKQQVVPVTLHLGKPPKEGLSIVLGEKQSRLLTYKFLLPDGVVGLYSLDLSDYTRNSVLILIEETQVVTADKSPAEQAAAVNSADVTFRAKDRGEEPANRFFANFFGHDPIYFLYGEQKSNAKFQISFKYRFIDEKGSIAQYAPWASGFYLGYTQTAFWDLASASNPFFDTIFKPTIFYQHKFRRWALFSSSSRTSIKAGFEHQSNGKAGLESRSLNLGFIEPHTIFSLGNNIELDIKARAWVYLADLSDNPDIRDFRGNSSVSMGIGDPDGWMLTSELRGNFGTGKGNLEFNLSYPLDRIFYNNLDLYLFGQLYTGYGESLIDYNRRDTRLRFGIALQR